MPPEPNFVVAALYHFAPLSGLGDLRDHLQKSCENNNICGTLLLAPEGINGTISGARHGIDQILAELRQIPGLEQLEHKESFANEAPFYRMKVRLKKEIVTMGVPDIDPVREVGTYVAPQEWNDLISDPETILIDTRNDYEVKIGTFEGAVDPQLKTFRSFPQYVQENFDKNKHRKVAMFCTGGIRCEKASAYMKKLGFEEVYHLKGGILKYLEEIPPEQSKWQGECFVFDQRVSVGHGLALGQYDLCPSCRAPLSTEDKASDKYIEGVACPHCYDVLPQSKKDAAAERQKQILLALARGEKHLGAVKKSKGGGA